MSTQIETLSLPSNSETTTSSATSPHTEKKRCCSFLCNALPVFHPYGPIRLCWDAFIMLALIYTAVEIPLTLAFEIKLSLTNTLGIIAFCIDILLLIDICVNFRTQYYDKWDRLLLHTNPYDIAKKYFKSWFWLDLITSFPVEFIVNSNGPRDSNFSAYIKVLRIFRLFRILKMLRVIRIIKMFDGLSKMMDIAREMFFVMRLWKILGGMILTAHYFACIWWHIGMTGYREDIEPETNEDGVTSFSSWIQAQGIDMDDPLIVKYSASWYWAVVTLFTTGYGDITAHNVIEQWVCSVCILTGSCLFAYFIGTLTTWVAEGDRVRGFEMQKVEEAQAFCRHHKFDRELTRTILTHVRYYCNYNFVFDNEDIIPLLPPFLQRKVNQQIAHRSLSKMDLFKDLPKEIIGQIALTMYSISCNAEKFLFTRGDVAKCMYLQRTGEARLRYFDGTASRKLKRGDVIGERALIAGKRRYDVKCLRWSEFFVLHIDSIKEIFRRSFKPKRFKYEWNEIRKKVKMSEMRNTKSQRRCNLATHKSEYVSRQVIHELSVRGKTLRSDIMEKFMRSPKKKTQHSGEIYESVSQKDVDDNVNTPMTIPENTYVQSSVLDIDDINSIQLIDISKPVSTYKSEFIQSNATRPRAKSCIVTNNNVNNMKNNNNNDNDSPKFHKRSGSSSFFHMPWVARHNSERRNEKVKTHTEQTAYGKKDKDTPPSTENIFYNNNNTQLIGNKTNSFQFNSNNNNINYNSDEELDLDFSDDSDLLAPLNANTSKRRFAGGSSVIRTGLGKFGHNKKRNMSKKRLNINAPIMSSTMKNVSINTLEIVEDNKNNNCESDSDNNSNSEKKDNKKDILLLNEQHIQTDKSAKKILELSKITQSVIRNCSYEKAVKSRSYEMAHSGSSSCDDSQNKQQQNNKNKKIRSKKT